MLLEQEVAEGKAEGHSKKMGLSLCQGLEGHNMTEQITVSVDSDVANRYRSASNQERRKLDLLINLRLRDVTESGKSLRDTMLEISRNAQQRGLTPEILQSILDEE